MAARDGFSFAEVLASVVIVLLLISVTITWYGGVTEDARASMARVEAKKIVVMIEARELSTRADYRTPALPPSYAGSGLDPWGQPWRVDPERSAVLSAGPDGKLDGGADDISVSWEPLVTRPTTATAATTATSGAE